MNKDDDLYNELKKALGFEELNGDPSERIGDKLVIGKNYRYMEWDDNSNFVDCEYIGKIPTSEGIGYEFKYITGSKGRFVTLYPEKLTELKDE